MILKTFKLIKATFNIVFDMINATYRDKPLILSELRINAVYHDKPIMEIKRISDHSHHIYFVTSCNFLMLNNLWAK